MLCLKCFSSKDKYVLADSPTVVHIRKPSTRIRPPPKVGTKIKINSQNGRVSSSSTPITDTPTPTAANSPATVDKTPEPHNATAASARAKTRAPAVPGNPRPEITKDEDEILEGSDHESRLSGGMSEERISSTEGDLTDSDADSLRPRKKRSVRRSVIRPVVSQYDDAAEENFEEHFKDPSDHELIKEAIQRNTFLNKILKGAQLTDVVNAMYNREVSPKEVIIQEGQQGSHMYVSAKGRFEVKVRGKTVKIIDDVEVFGELAILYNAKRQATITAETAGRVWVLKRSAYQQIKVRSNMQEQDELFQFLQEVPKLNSVGEEVLLKVTALLQVEPFFHTGTRIIKQGDRGDKFYIIRAGTVTVSKEGEGVVNQLGAGKYFGEMALLGEDVRQATVTADAPGVECLSLKRQHFINHFGELEDILTAPRTSKKMSTLSHADLKSPPQSPSEYQNIELDDLETVTTLGVGGFGRVELVKHKRDPNVIFALKYLKKIDMVDQNQQQHVYNERNIQMVCNSKFIVRLYRSYKSRKYIYFLMEAGMGGDLWTQLQRQKLRRFSEKDSLFIAACVLEAFAYLHERGIVYRDLKPENLLIDHNGYIKLTDFGFAKKLGRRGRTDTFAGTPEYVAPEIILNKGHDKAVDYWAFGCFIFELLTGRTPFRTNDKSHMRTYNRILTGIENVDFPPFVSYKARNIIEKLCKGVPTERLGCSKTGVKDIKGHRWFLGFDWDKLHQGKMAAPFKPKLKSPTDTRYFDKFGKDDDIPPDETSGWDKDF